MMDLLTGDAGLALFAAMGIAVTALSIVRDAKEQKARHLIVTEELASDLDLRRAA